MDSYLKGILNSVQVDTHENVRMFFSYFRQHGRLIVNLINADLLHIVIDRCIVSFQSISQEMACNKLYSKEKQKYCIAYIAGGLYNVFIEWARGGMKESNDYIANIVSELIV